MQGAEGAANVFILRGVCVLVIDLRLSGDLIGRCFAKGITSTYLFGCVLKFFESQGLSAYSVLPC
jgi:hypothetical protein